MYRPTRQRLLLSSIIVLLYLGIYCFIIGTNGAKLAPMSRNARHQQQDTIDRLGAQLDLDGQQQTNGTAAVMNIIAATKDRFNFQDGAYLAQECHVNPDTYVNDLDDECKIIKSFNQTALDSMEHDDMIDLVSYCACQLANMYEQWKLSFDRTSSTRRVATMVDRVLNRQMLTNNNHSVTQQQQVTPKVQLKNNEESRRILATSSSPNYLWSDIDVAIYQISIYTATADFFYQQEHNKSMTMSAKLRNELERDHVWRLIWEVCRLIVRDPFNYYRYMENINRASPAIFFNTLQISDDMATVYDASKACKLPLMMQFEQYKLKAKQSNDRYLNPPSSVSVGTYNNGTWRLDAAAAASDPALIESNTIRTNNDLDTMLNNDASALLLRCDKWHRDSVQNSRPRAGQLNQMTNATQELARDCPMMVSENGPAEWIKEHSSPLDRSMAAIRCGCQLIGHNTTWARMMRDQNVQLMSKSLTNYMNRNQVPDFANTPIWSIFGWFENIMAKFVGNRKMTIKEVVKTLSGDQDPLEMKSKDDSALALELCRRACNFIIFNYNKGSKEQQIELKSILYLDNLQTISQDPMFVFHLTLQDPNLFKLHALSKMCRPFVS